MKERLSHGRILPAAHKTSDPSTSTKKNEVLGRHPYLLEDYFSGGRPKESEKQEDDFHVYERSFGSFYRSINLPFTPEEDLIDANLTKGVLKVVIQKPRELVSTSKNIKVKSAD